MVEFRVWDYLSIRRLLYWRLILWQSQYYTAEKMRALQWKLLSRLLDHCFKNVPYYRRLFAELGLRRSDFNSLEDISSIPVMNRDSLLDHHEEFKSDDYLRYRPREIYTSGSTGTPLKVYWDLDSNVLELTCQWRHFSWTGYRLGDPFLDIRSRLFDAPEGYKWNWKCRGLDMSSDHIAAADINKYAEILRKYRPKLWRGHPHSIDFLCRVLSEAGIDDLKPKSIFNVGQPLMDQQRKFVESWISAPMYDTYGLKEHNAMVCQCPQGGHHIVSEYGIFEIIKDDGTPAQPGEEGRITATGLHNKAFPLLRYDTGDYAVPTDGICPCGRTLPLVEGIKGRTNDFALTADGKWVSAVNFASIALKGFRKSQIVQEEPGSVDLYLVPTKDYSRETEALLSDVLKKRLGASMVVRIHAVEEVPYSAPGKFKFFVSRLDGTKLYKGKDGPAA